jgi:hypothetical protein
MKALVTDSGFVVEIVVEEFPVVDTWSWVEVPPGQTPRYGDIYKGGKFLTPTDLIDPKVANNESIDIQIRTLEASQTLRRIRDAIIGGPGSPAEQWIADLEKKIAALRSQLEK